MKDHRQTRLRHAALPLMLSGALFVAACTGETPTTAPQLSNTEPAATQPLAATEVTVEAATLQPTTAPESTPVAAATQESTAPAAVDTPGAGETAMPAAGTEVEEVLVQASDLVGMSLGALDGMSLGTIRDVLVDQSGDIQYVVVELPGIGGGQPQNVIVNWSMLETIVSDTDLTDAGLEDVQLNFSGSVQDLAAAMPVVMNEDFGAILTSAGTDLPQELDSLVSLAQVNALALQDTADQQLGQLQDAFVDIREGRVDYVVLDLAAAGAAADTQIIVPWERLTIDPAQAAAAQALVLDVAPETLQNAPPVDLTNLPQFIDPNMMNWETIMDFWDSLG